MSKQRGKGRHEDRRKQRHKGGHNSKYHHFAEQHSTKFDEERFLRDMESALDRTIFISLFYYC